MEQAVEVRGHAFISYVREDSPQVDRLQRALHNAGIPVWRDTADLWPGQDWRLEIHRAITNGALVFIACFSNNSLRRPRTYQNEELALAIEQLRQRRPEQTWLIPARFDDCEVPDRDIGGGRMLSSIQRVDLFDDHFEENVARLVTAIRRILGEKSSRVNHEKLTDDVDQVLDDLDAVLESDAEKFVEGFIQGPGGTDEGNSPADVLMLYPRLESLLASDNSEYSDERLIEFVLSLLMLLFTSFGPIEYADSNSLLFRAMANRAIESRWPLDVNVPALLQDLEAGAQPSGAIRYHLHITDRDLVDYIDEYCGNDQEIVIAFRGKVKELRQLVRDRAHRRPNLGRARQLSGREVLNAYRRVIRAQKFDEARAIFSSLAHSDAGMAHEARRETGFIWLEDRDREVMAGLWSSLAVGNSSLSAIRNRVARATATVLLADAPDAPQHETGQASHTRRSAGGAARDVLTRSGASRDLDVPRLIRGLFKLSELEMRDIAGKIADGGTQQQRFVEFQVQTTGVSPSICYVLCFLGSSPVTIDVLAPEIMSRETSLLGSEVDNLVLFSFNSEINADLLDLAASWERREAYSFAVRLFGASELRQAIAEPGTVRDALYPRPRVPKVWCRYLSNPALLTFPGEEHAPLDLAYRTQLPTRFADHRGVPLAGTAVEYVQAWLGGDQSSLVVVGDFGDGKTFFTYNLARKLCETSTASAEPVHMPVRFALRDLPTAGSAREFLSRRLADVGINMADWQIFVNSHPTLVILDGFDEMSTDLSKDSILENIKLLRSCYQLFATSKVLLTSRSRAFGSPVDQQRLFDRVGRPELVHLRPFERLEVVDGLMGSARNDAERKKVNNLLNLHDPIDLATKPLYYAMIRDDLPDLAEEDFSEEALYEKDVHRTLHRKLEYLEDKHLEVGSERLVENLLSILERVATELQRSNAPYVYLQELDLRGMADIGGVQGLAKVLWRITGEPQSIAGDNSREDAAAQVGIRSLLKGHPEGDAARWPVDFCHQSMREYFVARAIARAVTAESDRPPTLLGHFRLSPEIVRFSALILRANGSPLAKRRLQWWARSVTIDDDLSPLGANALSLLYAYTGEVPGLNWSRLQLDYAHLAGADLEGRSFRSSSLRHANLDNVNLSQADLRDADLTGVRLEETASVTAIAVGPGDAVYAAYGDMSLRKWEFDAGRVTDRLLRSLEHRVERLWRTPCGRLVATGESSLTMLDEDQGQWQPITSFRIKSRYRLPDFSDPMLLLGDEANGPGKLVWFDPTTNTGNVVELAGMRTWSALGDLGYAAASADRVAIQVGDVCGDWAEDQVSALALRPGASAGETLIAVGRHDGAVRLGQLVSIASGVRRTDLWTRHLHSGPITAVAFLDADRIVTGGMDRRLCITSISQVKPGEQTPTAYFELTLRCRGVQVEGMRGERERNLLRRLAARQESSR